MRNYERVYTLRNVARWKRIQKVINESGHSSTDLHIIDLC